LSLHEARGGGRRSAKKRKEVERKILVKGEGEISKQKKKGKRKIPSI